MALFFYISNGTKFYSKNYFRGSFSIQISNYKTAMKYVTLDINVLRSFNKLAFQMSKRNFILIQKILVQLTTFSQLF